MSDDMAVLIDECKDVIEEFEKVVSLKRKVQKAIFTLGEIKSTSYIFHEDSLDKVVREGYDLEIKNLVIKEIMSVLAKDKDKLKRLLGVGLNTAK